MKASPVPPPPRPAPEPPAPSRAIPSAATVASALKAATPPAAEPSAKRPEGGAGGRQPPQDETAEALATESPVPAAAPPEADLRELVITYDSATSQIVSVERVERGSGARTPISAEDVARLMTVAAIPNAGELAGETGSFAGESPLSSDAQAYYQGVLDVFRAVTGSPPPDQ